MKVDDLLAQMEDLIEEGKPSLVGGGKIKVDADAMRSIIADIKVNMPDEVIQARKIAAERKVILSAASDAAELKIKQAEIQARKLVEENEITKNAELNAAEIINEAKRQAAELIEKAKANSNEIITNAQNWAQELRSSASMFVDTIMNESDEILATSIEEFSKSLNKVRIASQQLKSATAKNPGN
ncbi:MAG: hypothetical protein IJJ85_09155 [Clostridia bacterium]|nr:hypothetical protein [Clostridia bacterium]